MNEKKIRLPEGTVLVFKDHDRPDQPPTLYGTNVECNLPLSSALIQWGRLMSMTGKPAEAACESFGKLVMDKLKEKP